MTHAPQTQRERQLIEASLRRIEELVSDLESLPPSRTQETARILVESVLDLHGLALARMLGEIMRAPQGEALLQQFAEDERIRAVLLLHGLHPEEIDGRVRKALEGLAERLAACGLAVELAQVSAGRALLKARATAPGGAFPPGLRDEIEAALLEAAPDLEAVEIGFSSQPQARGAASW